MLTRLRGKRNSMTRSILQAITKLGIDLQNNVHRNTFRRHSPRFRNRSLRNDIRIQLAESKGTVGVTVFTKGDSAAAVGTGIPGPKNHRTSLRQLKEAFAHPIGPKATNDRTLSHVVLPGDRMRIATRHDMAPDIGRNVKQALGTLSR